MMDFAINSTFLNFRQNGTCLRKIGYILIFAVEQPRPRTGTASNKRHASVSSTAAGVPDFRSGLHMC